MLQPRQQLYLTQTKRYQQLNSLSYIKYCYYSIIYQILLLTPKMLPHHKYTAKLLAANHRPDGRQPLQTRTHQAHFMPQKGHLLYQHGQSSVAVKVTTQIIAPKNQRPSQGTVFFRVDCSTCNGSFEQHRKIANQAAKLLQTVIVGSKALDPQSLCILSARYAWKVIVQCSVINDDGNILDCILNGAVLALMDVKKPLLRLQGDKIVSDQQVQQGLSLAHIPVSMSVSLSEGNVIADASGWQQGVSLSRVTVSMNVYKQVCSIHKPGGMGITEDTLTSIVQLAQNTVKQTTEWMRSIIKQRPPYVI